MSRRIARHMSYNSYIRRLEKLEQKFNPPPTIIDAGKAKEELLMMLEIQMAGEEKEEVEDEWTPEKEAIAQDLSALLEGKANWMQKAHNIKLINC